MSRRINIILPGKTVPILDRVTTNRSRFIDSAGRQLPPFVATSPANLPQVAGRDLLI